MKKWLASLFLIVTILTAFKAEGQTITQTYIDPCDNKVYVVVIPFGQNQTVAVIRGKSKIVTLADMNSGAFQIWVNSVFATPCPQNDAIRLAQEAAARAAADAAAKAAADAAAAAAAKAAADAAAKAASDAAAKAAAGAASNAAGNAASNAASGAASNAASNAASSAASGAASNAASGAAGGAASSAAASAAAPPPPTSAPPPPPASSSSPPPAQSGGSSSSSSSQSGGSSSSESKPTESKPAETKSDKPAEQKQEEKKTETKQEEKKEETKKEETKKEEKKEESKEEKKDEKKEDKKEEKKEEKKKEEKKKSESTNPMLLASDITAAEQAGGKYLASITIGVSKSSLAGDESYSGGLVINSNLSSIVTTGGYTKMKFENGNLDGIHSYGTAFAYLGGNYMNLLGYTFIKPTPKRGTYGYNVGIINLFLKNGNNGFDYNMASSAIVFWTKPYQYSKKLTISPQVFTMFAPISYNSASGVTNVNRHMGFLLGAAFDYKISKRFGFSFNYKMSGNTAPFSSFLSNFLIGSRMVL